METQKPTPPSPDVIKFLRSQGLHEQADALEKQFGLDFSNTDKWLNKFITQDAACLKIKSQVGTLSTVDDCVLIQGETGTGKELLARALHGSRKGQFIAINCAGMPRELVESELFGHAAGSFTGAKGEKPGLISVAKDGTLFLDEVGDLPLDLQAKLLRVIQERTLRKVGANSEEEVNTRFVAATHKDLMAAVLAGEFREDLYARLSTFELRIPPLRNRLGDIGLIIKDLDGDTDLAGKVNWSMVDLRLNVRTVQQVVRRYQVFKEVILPMKITVQ